MPPRRAEALHCVRRAVNSNKSIDHVCERLREHTVLKTHPGNGGDIPTVQIEERRKTVPARGGGVPKPPRVGFDADAKAEERRLTRPTGVCQSLRQPAMLLSTVEVIWDAFDSRALKNSMNPFCAGLPGAI